MTAISLTGSALRRDLTELGKWARRIAIIGFVFTGLGGLGLLAFFFVSGLGGTEELGLGVLSLLLIALVGLGLLAFYFYLALRLYRFGKALRFDREEVNNQALATGFSELAWVLKVTVVLTAILLVLMLAFLLLGGLGFLMPGL